MNRTSQPSLNSLTECGRHSVFFHMSYVCVRTHIWKGFSLYQCVTALSCPHLTQTESRGQLGYIKPAALLPSPARSLKSLCLYRRVKVATGKDRYLKKKQMFLCENKKTEHQICHCQGIRVFINTFTSTKIFYVALKTFE